MKELNVSDATLAFMAERTVASLIAPGVDMYKGMQALFASADVIIAIFPKAGEKRLGKVVIHGADFLRDAAEAGIETVGLTAVIPCRRHDQAVSLNHMFGDKTLGHLTTH